MPPSARCGHRLKKKPVSATVRRPIRELSCDSTDRQPADGKGQASTRSSQGEHIRPPCALVAPGATMACITGDSAQRTPSSEVRRRTSAFSHSRNETLDTWHGSRFTAASSSRDPNGQRAITGECAAQAPEAQGRARAHLGMTALRNRSTSTTLSSDDAALLDRFSSSLEAPRTGVGLVTPRPRG